MEDFINSIKPEIETLLIGLVIVVSDALIMLATSGQAITLALVWTVVGSQIASYLTSYYRSKRANPPEAKK